MIKKILISATKLFTQKIWWISIFLILISNLYWGWLATDRYVSSAHVVIQSPEIAPPELSFSSMLSGVAPNNTADLLLLREYLLSMDVLKQLDQAFHLRQHFSQNKIDFLSRLDSSTVPIETFHQHYLDRVSVVLDDYSGVLIIEAQMYNKPLAKKVVAHLIELGEAHMNQMGQRLALEQVQFIEAQVTELAQKFQQATQAVIAYQNDEGMLSPSETATSISTLIAQLHVELVKLKAKRDALSNYQSARSSEIIQLNNEIQSLQKQINTEKNKLTAANGEALNQISSEYEKLKLKAQFAQELYSNALATLEGTRVEAARKLKQVSIISEPNMPEYTTEPRRVYLMTVFTLVILFTTLILQMMIVIIKDHRD